MGAECLWKTQKWQKIFFLLSIVILHNVEPRAQLSGINCIVYNEEFMECTWKHSEGEANCTLYYWYVSEPAVECRNYIQQGGYNVGCNFSASDIIQFKDFHVFINGSSDSGIITASNKKFQLQDQVQPFPPGNLRVKTSESNGLLLKWDAPMDTERCLEYEIRHRNNKDKEWQKVSVTTQTKFNFVSVDPEKLYTFQVRSKINIYCGTTELWSGWSLPAYWGNFITDVNCIVHNEEYMTCTWNITGGNIKYTMYHWYVAEPAVECRNYIQQGGYNVGCNFSASDIIQFKDFHVLINGSSDSGIVTTSNRKFQLQDQVQPFPPGNLRVNTSESNGLLLKWDAPMDTERCLEYEIRHRNNKNKEWQKVSVTAQTKFNFVSVDPEKLYTFQVRSKINIYCGTTELWSGWSLPAYWGNFITDVNCIVHNEEYMTCTWNITGGNIKYTMYHWYVAEPAVECRNYIQQGGYNVGCNFSASDIIQFKDFHVLINGSSDSGIVTTSNRKFQLQDQVQPFPPGNLRVNTSESNGLLLKWDAPMDTERCLEYEIRHRNNKDKEWQKVSVTAQTKFNLASVDPKMLYIFQVRSKINIYCGTTELWSGWSLPAYWGNFITGVRISGRKRKGF
ncbi:prolactin receptor-like isoform X2 [Hemitrygon akajei]|uniref:prolactin receptor-like isoform X2 n=1 Tax=Hemitrygon akajei TaxID=2704970 RepID=UPI003BF9D073